MLAQMCPQHPSHFFMSFNQVGNKVAGAGIFQIIRKIVNFLPKLHDQTFMII